MYVLDQQIENCSSVKLIDIYSTAQSWRADRELLSMRNTNIRSLVHICPQVKQLFINRISFDCRLSNYLMDVFPDLDELYIHFSCYDNIKLRRQVKILNKAALQFSFLFNEDVKYKRQLFPC